LSSESPANRPHRVAAENQTRTCLATCNRANNLFAGCSHGGDNPVSPPLCLHREPVLRFSRTDDRKDPGSKNISLQKYQKKTVQILLLFSTIRNFRFAELFKSYNFSQCGVSTTLVRRRTASVWTFSYFYATGQILKVLTNEKRDKRAGLKVVLIDRSHFKLYTLKFSTNLCRLHPVRGLKP
jgi:hypothetical protein